MDRQWWRVLSDSASFSPFVSGFRCIRWFHASTLELSAVRPFVSLRSSQISDDIVLFPLLLSGPLSLYEFSVQGVYTVTEGQVWSGNLQVCFSSSGIVA
ncbi:unnamed protein product [Brassica napus]|uniref:(rape) hypothetical protein n=1 Tax=Brassica napus TaxID=3708 RepID=A0A816Z5M8_BRANA|nr:unnamed protein product [Brassica napus]